MNSPFMGLAWVLWIARSLPSTDFSPAREQISAGDFRHGKSPYWGEGRLPPWVLPWPCLVRASIVQHKHPALTATGADWQAEYHGGLPGLLWEQKVSGALGELSECNQKTHELWRNKVKFGKVFICPRNAVRAIRSLQPPTGSSAA